MPPILTAAAAHRPMISGDPAWRPWVFGADVPMLKALDQRCAEAGRDRATLETIPDDVAADLQRRILDPGVDGVIMNLVINGHQPGVVTMVGEMLHELLP